MIQSKNVELIQMVVRTFTRENEALFNQLTSLLYYYRGAITRDEVWHLTYAERERYIEFLNERFENAKEMMKNSIPVFL